VKGEASFTWAGKNYRYW